MKEIRRVLIVEDREYYQKIFTEIVESIGFISEVASTVEESKAKLARMLFHLALVDLSLDPEDPNNREGLDVLAQIKRLNQGTKAIILSAFGTIQDADKSFTEYDISGFIEKDKMDLDDIKRRILAASNEAIREITRPSRQQNIIDIVKGQAIPQFLEEFRVDARESEFSIRQRIHLEEFLSRLLRSMQPLLPDKRDALIHKLEDGEISVQARFWSKLLGAPIAAWFGKFDHMKKLLQNVGESALVKDMNFGEKIAEVFDSYTLPAVGGAIYTLPKTAFEEFQD